MKKILLFLGSLFALLILISISSVHKQPITLSQLKLTPEQYLKIARIDPNTGLPYLLPFGNESKIVKVSETRELKEVILTPLKVEQGPMFVRPEEIFMLKVVYKNLDDIPYQIATIVKVNKPWWEQVWDAITSFFGISSSKSNNLYEIVPIYYAIAMVDPQDYYQLEKGGKIVVYYPGGGSEVEPGYGCWDIILTDSVGMSQISRAFKQGVSTHDIMCGDIKKEFGIAHIVSEFGPVAIAYPFQIRINGTNKGKAIVKEVKINNTTREMVVITGCTDKGDGRSVTVKIPDPNDPTHTIEVTIPSRPHDCILNPGETVEFDFWGIVNPTPTGMIPRDVVGDVISAIYTEPDKVEEYKQKYPGAIHEVIIALGRLQDREIGITQKDIMQTLLSVGVPAAGGIAGSIFGGMLGTLIGATAGFAINYFTTGDFLKVPALQKIWNCYTRGVCVYKVAQIHTMKTYLVIASPLLQGEIYLVHVGLTIALVIFGGYLGRKIAGG